MEVVLKVKGKGLGLSTIAGSPELSGDRKGTIDSVLFHEAFRCLPKPSRPFSFLPCLIHRLYSDGGIPEECRVPQREEVSIRGRRGLRGQRSRPLGPRRVPRIKWRQNPRGFPSGSSVSSEIPSLPDGASTAIPSTMASK